MNIHGPYREHSPFVTIIIDVTTGWVFENGYAKEAARYFETAGSSFRTMLKKLPCRCMLKYQDKRGMLPMKVQGETRFLCLGVTICSLS